MDHGGRDATLRSAQYLPGVMFSLYLFALIVGGALLLFSLLGGSDHSDADLGHDGAHSPVQWLSIRTAIYFLFVFGGVGAILTKAWPPATMPLILGVALVTGLGIGAAVCLRLGSGEGEVGSGVSLRAPHYPLPTPHSLLPTSHSPLYRASRRR